jgi:hypothetical protein
LTGGPDLKTTALVAKFEKIEKFEKLTRSSVAELATHAEKRRQRGSSP